MSSDSPDVTPNLDGGDFDSSTPELIAVITKARALTNQYNQHPADDADGRRAILTELLGHLGDSAYIDVPFYCDYGKNISIGDHVYIGLNCTFVDNHKITIGNNTLIASGVDIATATHPVSAKERIIDDPARTNKYRTMSAPVTIGNNCWIGANATIVPGVTIGDNTTIGAGSVVIKDIPANSLAAGNPCRVIRELE
ncbi:sugar O-acetyltransferase [Sulfuriroseicoccus oceanibius]|uniref:Nodulation protein L n=1 Tax=Sulfuriroseicoccus oceanibius TaxID=2707525 RepID=A0A6B3LCE5_9BACT|nr:sugar O-acetyltransferase [Sulfuriroseicoccus oceanibius]QQL45073.1 sugar O-acetyltransferase [Sulfuriroseicoccus oceanibius]